MKRGSQMFRSTNVAMLSISLVLVSIASTADSRIEQVESGLLPTAASHLGAKISIKEQMKNYGVPGISIAVIEGGRLAWAKGYGVLNSSNGEPVTKNTLFQAASISKPLTALGALALVEKRKLNLDQDVNEYLKSWKIPNNKFTKSRRVTLRMLLSHSGGVGDIVYKASAPGQPAATLLQILKGESPANNFPIDITQTPGASYAYSKGGYDILQQLMVDVSGESFDSLMKAMVFQPIGMAHSTFKLPLDTSTISIATGHRAGGEPLGAWPAEIAEMAVAGLWSTPSDLSRYLIEIQRSERSTGRNLLSSDLTKEMLTPQKGHHGLGPVISGNGATARFGHDGFNAGFESSMIGYISGGQGAVVMANSSFAFVLIHEIIESIARVYQWPNYDSTNMRPPEAPLRQQEVTMVPMDLAAASVGQYRSDTNLEMTLTRKGAHLFLELPIDGQAEVYFASDSRLFCPQLLFSDFASPWLNLVRKENGDIDTIFAGYRSFAELKRVN